MMSGSVIGVGGWVGGMYMLDHKNIMSLLLMLLHFGDCLSPLPTAVFYHLFTGLGEGDSEQTERSPTKTDNVAKETLEEPDNSSKANSELKKTWGFRRSTVAKREMPVEAAADGTESRCPVRRSGRQSKRTDKLEEFLLTAKRGSRKSAPPSLESGDPPSQTPTDAETASEASFDGTPDTKTVEDKADSPERRTRSGTRKQTQRKTQGGRQTRAGSRATVKDEGSSENEEDGRDDANKDLLQDRKGDQSPEDDKTAKPQSELDSEEAGAVEPKNEHGDKNDKAETEKDADKETDEDSAEKPATMLVKRGQIRTYVNKKKAASKNSTPVKTPANKSVTPVKKETTPKATQPSGKIRKPQTEEDEDDDMDDDEEDEDDDDENDSSTSSSSSSGESDEGGYDPNALYCICRQKHNKRYFVIFGFYQ